MKTKLFCLAYLVLYACVCTSCDPETDGAGGFIEPIDPPVEKPQEPVPPSTDDLIKLNEKKMIVGANNWTEIVYGNGIYSR